MDSDSKEEEEEEEEEDDDDDEDDEGDKGDKGDKGEVSIGEMESEVGSTAGWRREEGAGVRGSSIVEVIVSD